MRAVGWADNEQVVPLNNTIQQDPLTDSLVPPALHVGPEVARRFCAICDTPSR